MARGSPGGPGFALPNVALLRQYRTREVGYRADVGPSTNLSMGRVIASVSPNEGQKHMPIERKPINHELGGVLYPGPLPRDYKPRGGIPYRVELGDDWKKLAFRWWVNAAELIYFNFRTGNPDEVNWYLHWYVGCKLPTKDGKNWEFSSNLKPGIIYRPRPKPIVSRDIMDEFNENMGSGTGLGKAINAEASHHSAHAWHFRLDISHFALMALEIAAVHLVELGIGGAVAAVVGGPLMGILNFMNLGMGHMDALDNIKTDRIRRGLSRGILLGAAGEKSAFIRTNFVDNSAEHNVDYPEQNKNFQNAYLWGLVHGLEYGRKLTRRETRLLFEQIDSFPPALFDPGDFYANRSRKSESERREYYIVAAAKFRKKSGGD